MKKIVLLAVTASALLAGPDMGGLVDYDAEDNYQAEVEEAQQIVPEPAIAPIVIAPVIEEKSCCSNKDSVDLMGGYNFTESNGALDDAATAGIRYNKNIAPNTYIQLGYDRVFNANYRNGNRISSGSSGTLPSNRSVSGDLGGSNGNNGNGSSDDNSNNGGNNNIDSSGNGVSQSAGTQLDRFYLNGLYEFCGEKKLTPYIFAGLGYENVRHESKDLESGGFFDAGAGLKYPINEDLNLITEAKALKRFDNSDLDIIAGLGIGMLFGAAAVHSAPTSEIENQHMTTPEVMPSIIPVETTPVALSSDNQTLDVVPVASSTSFMTRAVLDETPSHVYDRYDVVPIEEKGRYSSDSVAHSGDYYIQIAALFNSAGDSRYFQKLDDAGLNHQLKETTIRGRDVRLLLVGPYSSSADAKADLSSAKSIEKGAFVKKING